MISQSPACKICDKTNLLTMLKVANDFYCHPCFFAQKINIDDIEIYLTEIQKTVPVTHQLFQAAHALLFHIRQSSISKTGSCLVHEFINPKKNASGEN